MYALKRKARFTSRPITQRQNRKQAAGGAEAARGRAGILRKGWEVWPSFAYARRDDSYTRLFIKQNIKTVDI